MIVVLFRFWTKWLKCIYWQWIHLACTQLWRWCWWRCTRWRWRWWSPSRATPWPPFSSSCPPCHRSCWDKVSFSHLNEFPPLKAIFHFGHVNLINLINIIRQCSASPLSVNKCAGWAGGVYGVLVARVAGAVAHIRVGDIAEGGGQAGRGGRGYVEQPRVALRRKRTPAHARHVLWPYLSQCMSPEWDRLLTQKMLLWDFSWTNILSDV